MGKLDNIKIPDNFDSTIDLAIDKALNDKKKLKLRKRKSIAAGLSGILIVGTIALSSETTWAYIEVFTEKIESFLGRDSNAFDKYKFKGNQTDESKGLKFSIGEVMLDDRQLIVSMTLDYSNYKFKSNNINKENLYPSSVTVAIDDLVFTPQRSSIESEKIKGEDKNKILFTTSLSAIDTDKDGWSETPYEILDKIKSNKDYDVKISFNEVSKWEGQEYKPIFGKWEFKTKINASNILKDTKVYKINKTVKINEDTYKGDFTIEEVRVSPVSVKVKYNYDPYNTIAPMPRVVVKNQDEKELIDIFDSNSENGNCKDKKYMSGEFEFIGNEKNITVTPSLYFDDKVNLFEDGNIEIAID